MIDVENQVFGRLNEMEVQYFVGKSVRRKFQWDVFDHEAVEAEVELGLRYVLLR